MGAKKEEILEFVMDELGEALELSDILYKELGVSEKSIEKLDKDISPMIDEEGLYFILTVYKYVDEDDQIQEQGEARDC